VKIHVHAMTMLMLAVGPTAGAMAAEIVAVLPVHDRLLMVHFDEGHVEHHKAGQARSDEKVVISPLDVDKASAAGTWSLASTDDPAFAGGKAPTTVNRKSKGTKFAWFTDRWVDGRAVNDRPDHTKEHWVYLALPSPLQPGKTYTLNAGSLNTNANAPLTFTFDFEKLRSESVHVNLLGYVPDAPKKYGYVYHWAGDAGPVDFKTYEGNAFHVVSVADGKRVLSGNLAYRKPADAPETLHTTDSPPNGNFLGTDVWEADFSRLTAPGKYRLSVEGIGASFDFEVGPDVLRPAHRATLRALYHNRSGIELKQPFTEFTRPAPHHPKLTPGFAGKLKYTTVRMTEWGSEGGDAKALEAGFKGDLEDAWGWYQDAGDWDSYVTHLQVPRHLLLAYQLAPENFADGDSNIPESGNGIPDILDEATWLPRFCYRLRQELMRKGWGTGGIGLRVAGDAFGSDEGTKPDGSKFGRGSWQDTDRFYAVSGEDPWSTYGYAGVAAQLAHCLRLAGKPDPDGIDWTREAREAFAWASTNTRPGDERDELRAVRIHAAAALFVLTGDKAFETQFLTDTKDLTTASSLWWENIFGPYQYALIDSTSPAKPDVAALARFKAIAIANADMAILVANRRALRWAGKWEMPMLIGQQTTPWAIELAVGEKLLRPSNPTKATVYRAALYTTADYFLGTNSLNMVWMTGVGQRNVTEMFHMDAWYSGKGRYHEGLIPYSPWRKQTELGNGPWDIAWAHKTLHPAIDAWPGNERWFPNRCTPLGLEFTVHQNIAPAAAYYGLVSGKRR
jgi:endoglucanase